MKHISMKLFIVGLLTLCFNSLIAQVQKPVEPKTYIVKGGLDTWILTVNYMGRLQDSLENSDMPSKKVKSLNDTLKMIQSLIMSQVSPQWEAFRKEDSILNLKTKDSSKLKK